MFTDYKECFKSVGDNITDRKVLDIGVNMDIEKNAKHRLISYSYQIDLKKLVSAHPY